MSDDYQLRQDVDKLMARVEKNEYDNLTSGSKSLGNQLTDYEESLVDFSKDLEAYGSSLEEFSDILEHYGISLDDYRDNLTDFSSTLISLKNNLIDFNSELIDFDENNQNLDSDLSKLKDNLHRFVVATNNLATDLDTLDTSLNQLDDDVFGANGLNTILTNLNNQVNGKGGLVETLDSFEGQLDTLSSDNDNLLYTLTTLSGYLTSFQGTLSEFQAKIKKDLGQATYDKLNDEIIALFGAIANTNKNVTKVNSDVSDINSTIGDATNPANGTIRKNIQTVNNTANTANTNINNVQIDLYGSNKNSASPQAGSVKANLNKVKDTDVPAVQNILYGNGTAKNPADGSLLGDVYDTETGLEKAHDLIGGLDTTLNDKTNGLVKKTTDVINTVGDKTKGLVKQTNDVEAETKSVSKVVGDNNSGLVKQTNDLKGTVGDANSGLVKQTNDVVNTVGNANKGLVKQTNENTSNVNDLRTDVGTVNPTRDGNLQTQIDRLPSYVSEIRILETTTAKTTISNVSINTTLYIYVRPSELARKAYNDNNKISFGCTVIAPDNSTTNHDIEVTNWNSQVGSVNVYAFNTKFWTKKEAFLLGSHTFSQEGQYIIMCEGLVYIVQVTDDNNKLQSTQISASASDVKDLNNYTTGGFYYCNYTSNARYIRNTPFSTNNDGSTNPPFMNNYAFYLLVEPWGNNSCKQTITYYAYDAQTFIRTIYQGTAYPWHRIDGADKLSLSGGTLTGNVNFPVARTDATSNIPWAGTPTWNTNIWTTLRNNKSMICTVNEPNVKFWNVISIRHRNGSGDGNNYGMYIRTPMQDDSGLTYAKQKSANSFTDERTILDNKNAGTALPMELKSTWNVYGGTIKFYTDGLYVYVTFTGTFTGLNKASNAYSIKWTGFGTMPNTAYAPSVDTICHWEQSLGYFVISASGSVGIRNSNTTDSATVNCSTMYPLKSRMP